MNLCSENHSEICYEDRKCPMCELIEEHQKEIEKLQDENNSLEDDNKTLEKENTELIERYQTIKEGLLILKGEEPND